MNLDSLANWFQRLPQSEGSAAPASTSIAYPLSSPIHRSVWLPWPSSETPLGELWTGRGGRRCSRCKSTCTPSLHNRLCVVSFDPLTSHWLPSCFPLLSSCLSLLVACHPLLSCCLKANAKAMAKAKGARRRPRDQGQGHGQGQADSLTLWFSDSLTRWLSDSLTLWLSGFLTLWLSDSLTLWFPLCPSQWI
jgi:hypothetical protein